VEKYGTVRKDIDENMAHAGHLKRQTHTQNT